jgi:DNA-binding PucR family transcriptional regulator
VTETIDRRPNADERRCAARTSRRPGRHAAVCTPHRTRLRRTILSPTMPVGADAIVSDVARRIKTELPDLTPEMTGMFIDVIPEFRQDDAVQRLMVASTSSNLNAIADMLALNISLDDISVPPAAAEYARRFAQHDLSLEALLRAYRLGEHMFLQWALSVLGRLNLPVADALAATSRIANLCNSYIDQVIEGLIDIYEAERQQWDDRSDAARAAQIRAVLDSDGLDVGTAEEMLGVSLRGWHVAAVAWVDSARLDATGPDPGATLQSAARSLADAGRVPLSVLADSQTLWAWLASTGRPHPDPSRVEARLAHHPSLRIAFGEPASGLAGFRKSHREALRARGVAELGAHPDEQLYEHSRVALTGLLIERLDDVREWAHGVLGDLMRDDEAMARLRDTVRVFLDTGGSYLDAAARLHVHKNTVHYRVRRAEEVLGRPLTEGRLGIEVALLACHQLGLTTAAPAAAQAMPGR